MGRVPTDPDVEICTGVVEEKFDDNKRRGDSVTSEAPVAVESVVVEEEVSLISEGVSPCSENKTVMEGADVESDGDADAGREV